MSRLFDENHNPLPDAEAVIEGGYMARDKDGFLCVYNTMPERMRTFWLGSIGYGSLHINNERFPEITWKNKPVEVEIIIRKVKSSK